MRFTENTAKELQILDIIGISLEEMGYRVVRIKYLTVVRPMLQIMLDRLDLTQITIADCEKATKVISTLLDVEDPIESAYTLEVGSPGIDRPLTAIEDFQRFIGYEARIHSRILLEGRKRFRGLLHGVTEDAVQIRLQDSPPDAEGPGAEGGGTIATIPFDMITEAKLLLTDALIASHQRSQSANPETHTNEVI